MTFAGLHIGGSTAVRKFVITPDGTKLVATGNFTSVDGLARDQVAVLDIGGSAATVSPWHTNFFTSSCASVFDTFLRGVSVDPTGKYVVFTATGAYRAGTSCDTISRFELDPAEPNRTPTWINYTGGDTTTAAAISGPVVYVGGHFRWVNNPSAGDRGGQRAIECTGLAALNPVNGLALPCNPTRERGYGVHDFLVTPGGAGRGDRAVVRGRR